MNRWLYLAVITVSLLIAGGCARVEVVSSHPPGPKDGYYEYRVWVEWSAP